MKTGEQIEKRQLRPNRIWSIVGLILFIVGPYAYGNRLQEAAERSTNMLMSLGQVTSSIGILAGGILMSLGLNYVGKVVLFGGIFGAVVTFGSDAFIEVIRSLFQ